MTFSELIQTTVSRGSTLRTLRELLGILEYELEAADQLLPADHPAREYVESARETKLAMRAVIAELQRVESRGAA